ncbi:MAG: GntP family permease [Rhodothermales bacterium]
MTSAPYWPFIVLALGIITVVILIARLRIHAFLALMISAVVVGILSGELPGGEGVAHILRAVELPMREFGGIAGQIAFVIALAAIIGTAMMESGAADKIVNSLIGVFGERNAAIALIFSSLVLAIPVFFDTVFFLLIPLAQALRLKTGNNYVLFVMAIGGGAAITHHLVPPTPGPLIMAETLQVDLGVTIMAGLLSAILPAIAVYYGGKAINDRWDIPFRAPVISDINKTAQVSTADEHAWAPGIMLSLLPVVLPVLLISLSTIIGLSENTSMVAFSFLGNKNVAMMLGTMIAMWLWAKRKGWRMSDLGDAVGEPLQIAGIIILITCAGGAFGAMIKLAGIADAVAWATADFQISFILLGWITAAVMKIAQGSGTVAMITASSIMYAIIGDGSALGYHPIYVLLAIGFGAMFISWMNDSGFWVVAKLGGFTEQETLKTWTVMLGLIGIVGLVQLLIMAAIFPFV